ncbi:outer membrane protein assembly factor BamB [Marinomonas pollencensis]|uniref:Outer membrane protein assembly factor BamB n=1 Tax=Marinomonas pollencensis TaxID=491954 RepID=A0A3E0DHP6_9GAMM|nr:outer membrane protein assembly factor BamB [Marinomonas pollencensis]REG82228.1 Beta-barrel assembly machine subunit BamB [Marinomonas pollencensis]
MSKTLVTGVILAALMLQGCASSRPDLPSPASIDSEVDLDTSWRTGVDGDFGETSERYNLVAQDNDLFFVTREGSVYQLSQKDGDEVLHIETKYNPSSGVTRDADNVYFGTYEGQLVAVSLNKKTVEWTQKLSSEVLSEAAYYDGKLAVQTADGWLSLLSAKDGQVLWRAKEDLPALTVRGTSAPIIINGKVLAGFSDGKVKAFDLQTGKQLWAYEVGKPEGRYEVERLSDVDGRLVVKDGVVYAAAYNGTVTALSLQKGSPIWQRSIPSAVGVAVRDGLLVAVDLDSNVIALNAKNGSQVWENKTLAKRDLITPEFFRDYVAVMDRGGYVHLLDLKTGIVKGRDIANDDVAPGSRMVADGNQLFILTPDSDVTALSY